MRWIRSIVSLMGLTLLAACGAQAPAPVFFGHREPTPSRPQTAVQQAPATEQRLAPASAEGEITVQRGDTVYGIARRNNVPMRALIEANGLVAPFTLQAGQKLRLPGGRVHTVQRGETLYTVSRLYDLDAYSLAQANDLVAPYVISAGQTLRIPAQAGQLAVASAPMPAGAVPAAAPAGAITVQELPAPTASTAAPSAPPQAPLPEASASPRGETVAAAPAPPAARPVAPADPAQPAATPAVPEPAARSSRNFAWPVRGRILSGFGPKPDGLHNDGINIAARAGSAVLAAENGVVVYSGSELRGFGNLLLVRHADGYITAYAHLDKVLVAKGNKVSRGQAIATVGNSGGVDQPQLHFEIRKGTQAVDPTRFLAIAALDAPAQFAALSPSRVP